MRQNFKFIYITTPQWIHQRVQSKYIQVNLTQITKTQKKTPASNLHTDPKTKIKRRVTKRLEEEAMCGSMKAERRYPHKY